MVGHGVGRNMHEDPQVPNFGPAGQGPELREGVVIAIEPMVNAGGYEIEEGEDGWAIYTKDGSLSAHFEHTIAVTEDGPDVLTVIDGRGVELEFLLRGHFLGGLGGKAAHLLDELLAQFQQVEAEPLPLGLDLFQVRPGTRLGDRTAQDRRRRGDGLRLAARRGLLNFFFLQGHNKKFPARNNTGQRFKGAGM